MDYLNNAMSTGMNMSQSAVDGIMNMQSIFFDPTAILSMLSGLTKLDFGILTESCNWKDPDWNTCFTTESIMIPLFPFVFIILLLKIFMENMNIMAIKDKSSNVLAPGNHYVQTVYYKNSAVALMVSAGLEFLITPAFHIYIGYYIMSQNDTTSISFMVGLVQIFAAVFRALASIEQAVFGYFYYTNMFVNQKLVKNKKHLFNWHFTTLSDLTNKQLTWEDVETIVAWIEQHFIGWRRWGIIADTFLALALLGHPKTFGQGSIYAVQLPFVLALQIVYYLYPYYEFPYIPALY